MKAYGSRHKKAAIVGSSIIRGLTARRRARRTDVRPSLHMDERAHEHIVDRRSRRTPAKSSKSTIILANSGYVCNIYFFKQRP